MNNVNGCGAIANRFASYSLQPKFFIYAGSINNSTTTNAIAISKEEDSINVALAAIDNTVRFVYFSSCSIEDPTQASSPYVSHKKRMEQLIQASASNYLIFRLPQVLGLTDSEHGLVNDLVKAITLGERFELWRDASRNFIDLDDVYSIVHALLGGKTYSNRVINIASPCATPVPELVNVLEGYFGKTGNSELVARGCGYPVDTSAINDVIRQLGIDFGADYLSKAVNKYHAHCLKPTPLLSVIVPTYNQALGIDEFYRRTKAVLMCLQPRFNHELIFVNDFSIDDTYLKLKALAAADSNLKIVNFSRNFGNQIAITAGMKYCRGDIAVIIDDDLQDPPEIILDFLAKWYEGYKVVYGVRPKRQGINPLFKFFAKCYYKVIAALSDIKIPLDTGDFRLIDRVVIDQLLVMKEENRYYRGMVAWVGFRQTGYIYERDRRYAGVSNFSFKKYINFALSGLTSFTDKPLYFSSLLGFIITAMAFFLATYLVINKILNPGISIQGWTSLMTIVMFFGGLQLFSIGILGLYISKIYREVKQRPLFVVQDLININDSSKADT